MIFAILIIIIFLLGFGIGSLSKTHFEKIDNLSRIMAVSSSIAEIEKFAKENAQFLSEENVSLLVSRIEEIRADNVIMGDNVRVDTSILNNDDKTWLNPIIFNELEGANINSKKSFPKRRRKGKLNK